MGMFGGESRRVAAAQRFRCPPQPNAVVVRQAGEEAGQNRTAGVPGPHRGEKAVEADATTFQPAGGADVVTFSYSLSMIPDWFAAIENARAMLKPGGAIGVVDFYVARKFPRERLARHGWLTRTFWPAWFAIDNVFPSPDHIPFLQRHFEPLSLEERLAKVPYVPLLRAPYYWFVGRKGSEAGDYRPQTLSA